jgi:hypothetical protein
VVLSVNFNLPMRSIASADLRPLHDGYGDIALKLAGDVRIGYVHLWPHARPWRIGAPEPMLRCLPQAQEAARVLTQAWVQANAHALQSSGHAGHVNSQVRVQNSAPASAPTSLPEGMQGAALGAPLMAPSSH